MSSHVRQYQGSVFRQLPDTTIVLRIFNRQFHPTDMLNVHLSNRKRYRQKEYIFRKLKTKLFITENFTEIPLLNKKWFEHIMSHCKIFHEFKLNSGSVPMVNECYMIFLTNLLENYGTITRVSLTLQNKIQMKEIKKGNWTIAEVLFSAEVLDMLWCKLPQPST